MGDGGRRLSPERYRGWPHLLTWHTSREVCCSTRTRIRECYWKTAKPHAVHWILSAAVFSSEHQWYSQDQSEGHQEDCRDLRLILKDSGVYAVFLSDFLVKGEEFERASQIWWNNKLWQEWSHSQGFSSFDHETRFGSIGDRRGLSVREGWSIFNHRFTKLVKRALN